MLGTHAREKTIEQTIAVAPRFPLGRLFLPPSPYALSPIRALLLQLPKTCATLASWYWALDWLRRWSIVDGAPCYLQTCCLYAHSVCKRMHEPTMMHICPFAEQYAKDAQKETWSYASVTIILDPRRNRNWRVNVSTCIHIHVCIYRHIWKRLWWMINKNNKW